MASLRVTFVVAIMCMVVVSAPIAEAVTCGQVVGFITPCITYLQGGPGPSLACCGGVKSLRSVAVTTLDRQDACNCLKQAAGAIFGFDNNQAEALPGKCGVNLPYKISSTTDCNSISF